MLPLWTLRLCFLIHSLAFRPWTHVPSQVIQAWGRHRRPAWLSGPQTTVPEALVDLDWSLDPLRTSGHRSSARPRLAFLNAELHHLKILSWPRRSTQDRSACWHVSFPVHHVCLHMCSQHWEEEVLKPQLSIFLRVCVAAGGGGSGYCRAACQLCCPRFTLLDSLWRQRLWLGSRVSVRGLRLQGIGGLHQPLESSWQSLRHGLLPEHRSQTNVWVSALTQPKRAFEKNQRQIFRKSGNDAFVNYLFSSWKWFEVSCWIARISCSVSCSFLRSWACLGQPAASGREVAGSGRDCCLGCLVVARAEKALGTCYFILPQVHQQYSSNEMDSQKGLIWYVYS